MTIVILDDEGNEKVRLNPELLPQQWIDMLRAFLEKEAEATTFTVSILERHRPGMLHKHDAEVSA